MPRSLRWLSAVSTAVVSLFVYTVLTLGIAKATGTEKIRGGAQLLVSLAVNDWLREQYGRPAKGSASSERSATPQSR